MYFCHFSFPPVACGVAYGVGRVASRRCIVSVGMGTSNGDVNPVLACGIRESCNNIHDRVGGASVVPSPPKQKGRQKKSDKREKGKEAAPIVPPEQRREGVRIPYYSVDLSAM